MTRTALVTGSAGFVGRHITAELERRGWAVDKVDLAYGPKGAGCAPRRRDALDVFRERPDRRPYDLAVHCAALVGGRATIDGRPLAVATNLALDSWFVDWMVWGGARHGIYYSSSAAYPVELQRGKECGPLAESDLRLPTLPLLHPALGPDNTYGQTKATGEHLVEQAREHGASLTVLRPFSGYGTDQSVDYPFPAFIQRARRREDPFVVWGTGQQTRDFIHIDDVVRLSLRAAELRLPGPYNLCTGRGVSFLQFARMVTEAAGYAPEIRTLPDKPTGVHYRVGNPDRMRADLGEPQVSLEDGIRQALAEVSA